MDKLEIKVDKGSPEIRLDKYVQERLSDTFSRSQIKKLIEEGLIKVNSLRVKAHHRIKPDDKIEITPREFSSADHLIKPAEIALDIIYEDEDILVVNKPAGLVVHPAAGHFDDTLVNALLFHTRELSDVNGEGKPGIVHRIDKDTSGLLVIAKNNSAHRSLANQFKQHKVVKVYLAVVRGVVEHDEGLIDASITRSPFDRKKMTVMEGAARNAVTRFKVMSRREKYTVVEAYPQTGRTHQIRVHFAHIGHPLLGDTAYGRGFCFPGVKRQLLHAYRLKFTHPAAKKTVEFEAPIPDDMRNFIT